VTDEAKQHEAGGGDATASDTHRDADASANIAPDIAPTDGAPTDGAPTDAAPLPDAAALELDEQPAEPPLSPQPEDEPIGLFEWLWLAGCTLLGAAFRAVNLAGRPLWDDELTTLITIRRPIADGLISPQDPQPPLYQLLLRAMTGGDEFDHVAEFFEVVAALFLLAR